MPEEGCVEDDPATCQQPEGERVEAREGHVPGADHQRYEVVAKARPHRDDEQEDHRRAVQGEQLVVVLGGHQRVVGDRELAAHDQRLGSAEAEEHEREDEVHDADLLVIGGEDPIHPLLRLTRLMDLVSEDLRDRLDRVFLRGDGGHAMH
jgi:hypothetical protein